MSVALVARTGLRWGELIALGPRDIHLDKRLVHVTRFIEQDDDYCLSVKGHQNQECRDVPIPASVVDRAVSDSGEVLGPCLAPEPAVDRAAVEISTGTR